jgi:hypothetical protein
LHLLFKVNNYEMPAILCRFIRGTICFLQKENLTTSLPAQPQVMVQVPLWERAVGD